MRSDLEAPALPASLESARDEAREKAEWLAVQRASLRRFLSRRRSLALVEKVVPSWSMDAVLESPDGVEALRAYCKEQLSVENLEFLLAARVWREAWATSDEPTRQLSANGLVERFLRSGAEMEVRLPTGSGSFKTLSTRMFDDAMSHTRKTLLEDVWPRFEETEHALKLKAEVLSQTKAVPSVADCGAVEGEGLVEDQTADLSGGSDTSPHDNPGSTERVTSTSDGSGDGAAEDGEAERPPREGFAFLYTIDDEPPDEMAIASHTPEATASAALRTIASVSRGGRFASAALEMAFNRQLVQSERRGASAAAKGHLGLLLLFGAAEGLWAASGPSSHTLQAWRQPWKYALVALGAGVVSLLMVTFAEMHQGRLWTRLSMRSTRLLSFIYHAVFGALTIEAVHQRDSDLARATPFFAFILPAVGLSGALPLRHTLLVCVFILGVHIATAFHFSYPEYRLPDRQQPLSLEATSASGLLAALRLAWPWLLIIWLTALACWEGAVRLSQQRLALGLSATIRRQEARTSAMLGRMLPAPIVTALRQGLTPLLSHGAVSVIVARPVGLFELLHAERAGVLYTSLMGAWQEAMRQHRCTPIRSFGDTLVAVCGAPTSCELHAEKACAAALAAVSSVTALAAELDIQVALRVGIASGPALSAALGPARAAYGVWGEAEHHAGWLQRVAPAGGILASHSTLEAISTAACGVGERSAASVKRFTFTEWAGSSDDVPSCYLVNARVVRAIDEAS